MKGLLIVLLLITSLDTFGVILGQREGGGGNLVAAEFAAIGRTAIEFLGEADESLEVKLILDIISSVKISPEKRLCFQDFTTGATICYDALYNSSNNEIKFDVTSWNTFNCRSKMTLATHEYLRAAGVESGDYTVSGRFLSNKFFHEDEHKTTEIDEANSAYARELDRICREFFQYRSKQ